MLDSSRAHAHRMRGYRWASDASSFEDMQRKVPKSVGACYDMIETRMLRPWVMGKNYAIADPYLFTITQWLEDDGVDPTRTPHAHGGSGQREKGHCRGTGGFDGRYWVNTGHSSDLG